MKTISFFLAAIYFTLGVGTAQSQTTATTVTGPATAPLSYIADPAVYKIIKEDDKFRVIEVFRPPGHRDAWHSHSPGVVYNLSDCPSKLYLPNGQVITPPSTAMGSVTIQGAVASHTAENIGTTPCHQLIVEQK
jgi:hypothetical protein